MLTVISAILWAKVHLILFVNSSIRFQDLRSKSRSRRKNHPKMGKFGIPRLREGEYFQIWLTSQNGKAQLFRAVAPSLKPVHNLDKDRSTLIHRLSGHLDQTLGDNDKLVHYAWNGAHGRLWYFNNGQITQFYKVC